MEVGAYGWGRNVDYFQANAQFWTATPPTTGTRGVLSLGGAAFDGLSSGAFNGNSGGQVLAVNVPSNYGGYIFTFQNNGLMVGFMDAGGRVFFTPQTFNTATYGRLNLGNAGFGSVGGTNFAGSSSGTHLAINAESGFAGNLADWQVAGVSQFSVSAVGAISRYAASTPANGQLLIGNTTNGNFSLATLTQGANVTITNGPGTITIAASAASSPTQNIDTYYQFT